MAAAFQFHSIQDIFLMGYFEVCFISKYWVAFQISFCYYLYFSSFIVMKHILYDLNSSKFIEVCFMAQNMIYLGECFICS